MTDFYEEDEPIEEIRRAWDEGKKGRTRKGPPLLDRLALWWLARRRRQWAAITGTTFKGGIRIVDTPNVIVKNNTFLRDV